MEEQNEAEQPNKNVGLDYVMLIVMLAMFILGALCGMFATLTFVGYFPKI